MKISTKVFSIIFTCIILFGCASGSKPIKASEIKIDKSEIALYINETALLTAKILPDNAVDKNISWSSTDDNIATVNNGTVKGINIGVAYITAEIKSQNISTTVKVTVNYKQYSQPFANVPSVGDVVIYEVNLRAFSSEGNIQSVINRLDKIKELGVNVIWLMPTYPIGQVNTVNSPYCVKDYKAVNAEYGTIADLKNLTDAAHAKGMAVMLDWVANHTAWDNEWIKNKSWYTQDASGNIVAPIADWKDVADLNYGNYDMRAAMIDAMKYWILEANIDGYRCDYADGVPINFWKTAIDTLRVIPNRKLLFLAEGQYTDQLTAGFDILYGWDYYTAMKSVFKGSTANSLYTTHLAEYKNVPSGKSRLRYTTNHDTSAWEATPITLYNGKNGALAASAANIFMGGTPLFYTGQEVGRESLQPMFTKSPVDWTANQDMFNSYKEMMKVYTGLEVARKGDTVNFSNFNTVCLKKSLNNSEFLVVVNMRNEVNTFTIPTELRNTDWTNAITGNAVKLREAVELGNYEYLLLKK